MLDLPKSMKLNSVTIFLLCRAGYNPLSSILFPDPFNLDVVNNILLFTGLCFSFISEKVTHDV